MEPKPAQTWPTLAVPGVQDVVAIRRSIWVSGFKADLLSTGEDQFQGGFEHHLQKWSGGGGGDSSVVVVGSGGGCGKEEWWVSVFIVRITVTTATTTTTIIQELKHALTQAGGPTQSQLSRPVSSGHHISMEHRLRRKQLNSDTNASNKTYLKEIQEKRKEETFFFRKNVQGK